MGSSSLFSRSLLAWFDEHARDLPWRRTQDPYAIWVSEVMLQQTRVAAVVDFYTRFLERFPTINALAAAKEDDVLALWSGLGYYRRARMLHHAAQFVAAEHAGKLPKSSVLLRKLPGIGDYTSAAIASIGFGEAIPVVDGNVERVITRYVGLDAAKTAPGRLVAEVRERAQELLDRKRPGDFNQAVMELGATICLPKGPLCPRCPVFEGCATRGEHVSAPAKKMRSQQVACALVRRNPWPKSEVLLQQRPRDAAIMPGMWELPQVRPEEIDPNRLLLTVRHSITNTNYYVTVYELEEETARELRTKAAEEQWIPTRELPERAITGLTLKILKRMKLMPGYTGSGPAVAM